MEQELQGRVGIVTGASSGIGLSIVKAIMESHRQAYGVENREDGVEFWFELACAKEDLDCTESRTP